MDPIVDHEATATPHQLCNVCETIVNFYFDNWDIFDEVGSAQAPRFKGKAGPTTDRLLSPYSSYRKYHANVDSMRSAAAQGCHLCALLAGGPESMRHVAMDQQLYVSCHKVGKPFMVLWYLRTVDDPTSWGLSKRVDIERTLYDSTQEARALDSICRKDALSDLDRPAWWNLSTGSAALRKTMADWLRQCIESHESCNKRLEYGAPTRLLDLNAFAECKDLRLVFSADTGAREKYVALSYCWGNRVTTTLRKSNLNAFVSRIPLSQLPKTVREAVEVCRGLNIRYLWVDALCIVQEDSEDFSHEVSRMGSIYANALVTIAAADSAHCNSGLYRSRMPLLYTNLVVVGSSATLSINGDAKVKCYRHSSLLDGTRLSHRAWAYQERVMAPRTIHFDGNEIVWECRERLFCPRCTDNAGIVARDHKLIKRVFTELHQSSAVKATISSIQRVWFDIVRFYTPTNLSNENDRLSALAGIAQLISQQYGYKASHGLWLPFFKDELLWHASDEEDENPRREAYRANVSSWAWAVGPHMLWRPSEHEGTERVYSCTLTMLPRPTPFGQLSSLQPASFRVRGRLTPCRVTSEPPLGQYRWQWILSKRIEHSEHSAYPWFQPQNPEGWHLSIWPDRFDMGEQNVVCITIRRTYMSIPDRDFCRTTDYGLVLSAVDTDMKVYRRVGYFEASINAKQACAQEEEGEVEIV